MTAAVEPPTHTIVGEPVPRWEAKIHVTEDIGTDQPFEFDEFLTATWHVYHSSSATDGVADPDTGHWLITGDNTGSQQLVVHPYMIPALIDLLRKLAEVSP